MWCYGFLHRSVATTVDLPLLSKNSPVAPVPPVRSIKEREKKHNRTGRTDDILVNFLQVLYVCISILRTWPEMLTPEESGKVQET